MRVFIFSFTGLIAIVAAIAVWWTGRDLDAERAQIEAERVEYNSRIGMRRMLSENGDFKIFDVALGRRLSDESREFRGFLQREGNAFPTYGRVRSVCESGVQKPECWEIVYLEANGREVETGYNEPAPEPVSPDLTNSGGNGAQTSPEPTAAESDPAEADEEPAVNLAALPDASAVEKQPPAAAEGKQPPAAEAAEPEDIVEPQPDPAPVAAGPSSTHQVVPSRVNARQGPGITEQILAVLTKGTELSLLGEQGGWGNFLVMQGDREGTTAWISLSIVAEIEP